MIDPDNELYRQTKVVLVDIEEDDIPEEVATETPADQREDDRVAACLAQLALDDEPISDVASSSADSSAVYLNGLLVLQHLFHL